ncbi:iron-containing alcohol dehydrogenase, partial [Mobilibacterium timonense]|uniref:iron-containing alcohol dehydrogenase n=1 Tax=Mobilibacterium timonense TaxID=1871012 RepID=UPI003A8D85CD
VPTTAGTGSETTLAAVITDARTRHKYAINDFPLIPRLDFLYKCVFCAFICYNSFKHINRWSNDT